MIAAGLLLAGYAVAAGFAAPALLHKDCSRRSPRTAMAVWLVLAVSWLATVPLAGLAVAAGLPLTWQAFAGRAPEAVSWPVTAAGVMFAVVVALSACWHLARGLRRTRREQDAHAEFLAAVGRPDQALDVTVLDEDAPAAYCVPRGRHRVAISAGALSRLSPGQLNAVLAHERAHLHGRHHLILAATAALGGAFPRVPLLAQAPAELAILAEMAADDTAARRHDPGDLAAGLVAFATAAPRTSALTVGGPAAIVRVQRLLGPDPSRGPAARAARVVACGAALLIPAAVTCLPLVMLLTRLW